MGKIRRRILRAILERLEKRASRAAPASGNAHLESSDDELDFDTSSLCDTCSRIEWKHVLRGTLSERGHDTFSARHMYNLDGIDKTGAPFLVAPVPVIDETVDRPPSCPLCHLWLRAYRRVYPTPNSRNHKKPWFTYYVNDNRYFGIWAGNPRGIDEDVQTWETRQKAMLSFRMRFCAYELSYGFEQLLELTCLDEQLPQESRSRGGRLLSDEGARPDLFKGWLEMCHSEHGASCESSLPPATLDEAARSFKLRLIDVEALEVVVGSLSDHYCALSYVWGDIESFKATATSLVPDARNPGQFSLPLGHHFAASEELERPQDLSAKVSSRIRRTIRDAVEVTRRLGLRYLWVDSLCIMQDDVDELNASIANMDIVYKQAVLTIVGAAGSNCDAGLPRSHPGAPRITQITGDVGGCTFMLAQPSLDLVLGNTIWISRGWTFQEGKLPSRLLIFTDYGIYFRCRADTWAEDSIEKVQFATRGRPGTFYYGSSDATYNQVEAAFAHYTYDVRLYTKRTLGVQADIIKAFTGFIMEISRSRLPSRFAWGLPQRYLDAALLWKATRLWDFHHWAYRDPGTVAELRARMPFPERGQNWGKIHEDALRDAARGFAWGPDAEDFKFPKLQRRQGFPSWSWCGWQGQTGYFPRTVNQPDLYLLESIESLVEWPWDDETNSDASYWELAVNQGILTFRAWCAMVDFNELPFGLVAEESRQGWVGWPMDGEEPLRSGTAECVLLSRQKMHPINHMGYLFEKNRTLDPVGYDEDKVPLMNVMVVARDGEGKASRRGIGMMREDIWWSFEPVRCSVQLV